MNAIVFANCLMGTSQPVDGSDARRKNREFQKFMDTLNWHKIVDKVEEQEKPKSAQTIMKSMFGGIGIVPFRERKK